MPFALGPLADLLHVGRLHLLQLFHRVRDEHLLQRFGKLDLRGDAAVLVHVDHEKHQHDLPMSTKRHCHDDLQQQKGRANHNDDNAGVRLLLLRHAEAIRVLRQEHLVFVAAVRHVARRNNRVHGKTNLRLTE